MIGMPVSVKVSTLVATITLHTNSSLELVLYNATDVIDMDMLLNFAIVIINYVDIVGENMTISFVPATMHHVV